MNKYGVTGELWELHQRALEAKGFRAACLHLSSYVRAILTVFNAEGGWHRTSLHHRWLLKNAWKGWCISGVDMWSYG